MTKKKTEHVNAYIFMFTDRLREGWRGYLLTFMFKHIPGSPYRVAEQMENELERVFAKSLTRIIRKKRLYKETLMLPFWLACPDYPVPKGREKKSILHEVTINDGRHMHVLVAIPPWSDLREDLETHFNEKQSHYVKPDGILSHIDVRWVTHDADYVGEYALKAILRNLVEETEILILPRSYSEMPTKEGRLSG